MDSEQVGLEPILERELLCAERALEHGLGPVFADNVVAQTATLREALVAELALERALARVHSQVLLQRVQQRELLVAKLASVGLAARPLLFQGFRRLLLDLHFLHF